MTSETTGNAAHAAKQARESAERAERAATRAEYAADRMLSWIRWGVTMTLMFVFAAILLLLTR